MVKIIPADSDRYVASLLESPTDVSRARHLLANVYQERGWVGTIDITDLGTISEEYDVWHPMALYFGVKDLLAPTDEIVVCGRILDPGDRGVDVLQTPSACQLPPDLRRTLDDAPMGTVVEISGLARATGVNAVATLHLYREMGAYSLRAGHRHWIMACDVDLSRRLIRLMGDSLEVVGAPTYFRGHTVVPIHVLIPENFERLIHPDLEQEPRTLAKRQQLADFFLQRTPAECLTPDGLRSGPVSRR